MLSFVVKKAYLALLVSVFKAVLEAPLKQVILPSDNIF